MFPPFFKIFHSCMLRSFMHKFPNFQPTGLVHGAKNRLLHQKCRFFQSPRYVDHNIAWGKERLSDVSSWLKRFYDHLRGLRDNLKFLHFQFLLASFMQPSCRFPTYAYQRFAKMQKFQIISKTAQVAVKPF